MATTTNALIKGFRGKFGDDMVFRTMRGKTFVSPPARKPAKKKESEAQRKTRTTFQEATQWAQIILLDPEKKAYYQQRAKALKLPNAYTAAITDYMRKPKMKKTENRGTITYRINKPGFTLNEVQVDDTIKEKVVIRQKNSTWFVHYTPDIDLLLPLTLLIIDNTRSEARFEDIPV